MFKGQFFLKKEKIFVRIPARGVVIHNALTLLMCKALRSNTVINWAVREPPLQRSTICIFDFCGGLDLQIYRASHRFTPTFSFLTLSFALSTLNSIFLILNPCFSLLAAILSILGFFHRTYFSFPAQLPLEIPLQFKLQLRFPIACSFPAHI